MSDTASKSRRMVAYAGILIINFLAMYLISGVGVYSYTVAEVFNNLPSVSMVFTLECVARGVSIPIGGKVGDKVGHKKLFLFAVTLYIICYAVAAFATGFWMFTIARMVSGFAWGLFMMNGFVLLSAIFGQADAPKYSGYNQSLTTVAMIIGAPIAGVVCAINWRLQFYVALVLLVIGLALCAYGIPTIPPKSGENSRLDLPGVIATGVTLVPFSLAMNWGSTYGWTSPLILALLAVTVVGLIALVLAERKAADPVFPAKLFKNRYYLCILLLMFIFSVGNGAGNYGPTYAQAVLGASSQISGLLNVPGLVLAVILTTLFGNYAAKTGRYKGMVMVWAIGALIGGVIWALLGTASTASMGLILLFAGAFPIASVNSVNQIAPYTYPMTILEPQDLATGLAFMGLAGALGSTIAGGLCAALMNSAGGLLLVFKVPVVCAVLMLLCAILFKDRKQA